MNIKEKAKEFADGLSMKSKSSESVEKMREIIEEIYIQSHREALTSILKELPEEIPNDPHDFYQFGWNAHRNQIKSLIQNKLKL